MGVTVTGGEGGIKACLEDLAAVSTVLSSTADTVTTAADAAAFARLQIGGCSGLDLGPANARLDELLADLGGHATTAQHAAEKLRGLAAVLRWVVKAYGETDHGLASMFGSVVTALPGAVAKGTFRLLSTGNPLEAGEQFLTADPELTDLFAATSPFTLAAAVGGDKIPDGHAVVRDKFTDVSLAGVTAPRGVGDLMDELAVRNDGESGEVSVAFAFGEGGVRHVIVDIPGTKSWSPGPTSDVTSLTTNMRAIGGETTTYEQGVLEAMAEAGVTSKDDVMLVGHSEGGMIAVNAARDADLAGTFHISHVVTAGSPIGHTVGGLGPNVDVLALEGRNDLVPRLDGTANPDRLNITTVSGGHDSGSIGENHSIEDSYLPLAHAVDRSSDGSIRAFLDSAQGFLDQDLMTTERYVITRGY